MPSSFSSSPYHYFLFLLLPLYFLLVCLRSSVCLDCFSCNNYSLLWNRWDVSWVSPGTGYGLRLFNWLLIICPSWNRPLKKKSPVFTINNWHHWRDLTNKHYLKWNIETVTTITYQIRVTKVTIFFYDFRYIMIAHHQMYNTIYKPVWIGCMIAFCYALSFGMQIPTLAGQWGKKQKYRVFIVILWSL